MFWHTSESQTYLIKNKSTKTRREIKIILPDNCVLSDTLLKAKNTWLKLNLLKQEKK